jgi:hypothetical protein
MDASLLQTVYLQNDLETKSRIESRESWVNQIVKETTGRKSDKERDDELAAQIRNVERRLERFRQQKNEEQIKTAEETLAKLRKQAAPKKEEPTKVDESTVKPLVESAYLRTLSRFPNADELALSTQYLVEDGDLANGLQDLLWALVNTKEFIVNH